MRQTSSRFWFFTITLMALMSASKPNLQKKRTVVLFGDSITQAGVAPGGYVRVMDTLLKAMKPDTDYDLIGAGIGGNKVYDLYLRMEADVLAKKPHIVVIYVGVNDVWHKQSSGTGTDPDKFVKFYQAMLDEFKAAGIRTMVCTPAVIGERTDFSNQLDGDLNLYSNMIRELAKKNNLPLVDLRTAFLEYNRKNNPQNLERGILTSDRVHLNPAGNRLVAEKIVEQLAVSN
jgi:lysophospholipase L1-like esterase